MRQNVSLTVKAPQKSTKVEIKFHVARKVIAEVLSKGMTASRVCWSVHGAGLKL